MHIGFKRTLLLLIIVLLIFLALSLYLTRFVRFSPETGEIKEETKQGLQKILPDDCFFASNRTSCIENLQGYGLEDYYIIDGCGSGTVLDVELNLCYQRDMGHWPAANWTNQMANCADLDLGDKGPGEWRLATRAEYMRIFDYGTSDVVGGNNLIFQNKQNEEYFTSGKRDASNAWYFRFTLGRYPGVVLFTPLKNSRRALCVAPNNNEQMPEWYQRQSQLHPDYTDGTIQNAPNATWFEDDGCGTGTMLDTATNLCWQKDINTTATTWANKMAYCNGLSLGDKGTGEWRLPEPKEFDTLIHSGLSSGYWSHLNEIGFNNFANDWYWTHTITGYNSNLAWGVTLGGGLVSFYDVITGSGRAVCVSRND